MLGILQETEAKRKIKEVNLTYKNSTNCFGFFFPYLGACPILAKQLENSEVKNKKLFPSSSLLGRKRRHPPVSSSYSARARRMSAVAAASAVKNYF